SSTTRSTRKSGATARSRTAIAGLTTCRPKSSRGCWNSTPSALVKRHVQVHRRTESAAPKAAAQARRRNGRRRTSSHDRFDTDISRDRGQRAYHSRAAQRAEVLDRLLPARLQVAEEAGRRAG